MLPRTRLLIAAAALFMAASGVAAAQTAPTPLYTQNGFAPHMLDTSVPKATRLQLFSKVIALANSGQVRAQDLAGTLYWQGSNTVGSPVTQDLAQARSLLANAAIHGDVIAMAKLAELELKAGRTVQAMVWAQMYARYLDPTAQARQPRTGRFAYASDLMRRIIKAGGKIDGTTKKDVGAMVTRYDALIRQGIRAFFAERRSGATHLITGTDGRDDPKYANLSGVAEYMVSFDASGAPGKIWLLAAYPDPQMGTILRDHLDHIRANRASNGSGMRYLRIPITHNASKYHYLFPKTH